MRISCFAILPAGGSSSKVCRSSILDILASPRHGQNPVPPRSNVLCYFSILIFIYYSIMKIECKLNFQTFQRMIVDKRRLGQKVLASQLSLDCRARRSGQVGSTTLISSAFTALLNCAEVGRRNRILTNYRFLSHSLSSDD